MLPFLLSILVLFLCLLLNLCKLLKDKLQKFFLLYPGPLTCHLLADAPAMGHPPRLLLLDMVLIDLFLLLLHFVLKVEDVELQVFNLVAKLFNIWRMVLIAL